MLLLALSSCSGPDDVCAAPFVANPDGHCALPEEREDTDTAPDTPSFERDVLALYESACDDCHEPWSGDGSPQGTYDALMAFADRDLGPLFTPGERDASAFYTKILGVDIEGGRMPLSPELFSTAEIEALRAWIAAGALDDATFQSAVETPFREHRCLNCHFEFQSDGGLYNTLTTRESGEWRLIVPGEPDQSLGYVKVASESPPFGEQMPLAFDYRSADEIERVGQWIDAGATFD